MATSIAALRALEAEGVRAGPGAAFVAGPFAGRILGAVRGGGADAVRHRAPAAHARARRCRRRCRSGVGAMAALLGLDFETAARGGRRGGAGRGLPGRERQRSRAGRRLGPQGGGRAGGGDRQGQGRQAGAAAAGQRALPLRADAARRRM